jgi:CRP/FNR family cyclic AMP-dependent transcriptional regulator
MASGEMTAARFAPLLDLDPDLGQLLPSGRLQGARRDLMVQVHTVKRGPWAIGETSSIGPQHFGLLVVEGVIVRELVLSDSVSAELLGPGDVIRPWQGHPARLLQSETRLIVLEPATFGVLDSRFVVAIGEYPEILAMLSDRLMDRTHRLAAEKAIAQLNGVERRIVALFWELAERWGRVTPDGILVPLALPHRVIAQLVGARRPTVSTALTRLAGEGQLLRRPDGGWLVTGDPVGEPVGEASRVIRSRRFRPRRTAPPSRPSSGALAWHR